MRSRQREPPLRGRHESGSRRGGERTSVGKRWCHVRRSARAKRLRSLPGIAAGMFKSESTVPLAPPGPATECQSQWRSLPVPAARRARRSPGGAAPAGSVRVTGPRRQPRPLRPSGLRGGDSDSDSERRPGSRLSGTQSPADSEDIAVLGSEQCHGARRCGPGS